MSLPQNLFSAMSKTMAPYSPIEPPDQIAKRLGISEDQIVKLDANENPYGTLPEAQAAVAKAQYGHIYPDPAQAQLKEAIARYAGVEPAQVIAGTGADELIDLVCRLVLEPGDQVLGFSPSFGYYGHVVALNRGVMINQARELDFSIDLKKAKAIDLKGVKLVLLCSPNNPTGNLVEEAVLDYFLSQDLIVMLDEAYQEFSQHNFVHKLAGHKNLVILRTFSKCFALAGYRVGYGLMGEELAQGLMRIKPPYSVSVPAEVALKACLAEPEHFKNQVAKLKTERARALQELAKFPGLTPYPSQSNFVLVKVAQNAAKLKADLEARGILVRYFNTPELNGYIRISMGRPEQMDRLYQTLHLLLA